MTRKKLFNSGFIGYKWLPSRFVHGHH